ncbi:MAG TPA: Re/Si-specific NAD(P)(+) transhydrogenase subunit alpha [bacterium]|nr:Re/Si-specific NAD(P)(+) transhydrogenase subunit alpha [bacterium]
MIIGVPRETLPGEQRVAMVPAVLPLLTKLGATVIVEAGAGAKAGYPDDDFRAKGAELVDRAAVFARADIVVQLHGYGADRDSNRPDLDALRPGQTLIGFHEALVRPEAIQELARRGVTVFSMELIPRITRAQSMDALSSLATVAGYKAALLAADQLPRMFPLLMTAAGTVAPARVLVIGAGVAGLQAIATAKRLGAVVSSYDIRPAVKEQVESLGAKFIELEIAAEDAEDKGGYAKAMGEEFYRRQRELLSHAIEASDVVITTAAVPGKRAPVLITADMAARMPSGSVIVDLASESGGNCELTKPGQTVRVGSVTVIGAVNLPSSVPYHASQLYARNVTNLLALLLKKGELVINHEDEIIHETLVIENGAIVHARVKDALAARA